MVKIEMRNDKHLWITFEEPNAGDPREVIIDKDENVRICDGKHVVKVRFEGARIKDVLVDDVFVYPITLTSAAPLRKLYSVERGLSHSLQAAVVGDKERFQEVTTARNNLRDIMRKMGWKGQF